MFNATKVKSWIPKKHEELVLEVDEDGEVVEVILNDGLHHSGELETMWVFGKDRYESGDYSLRQIKTDLLDWLANVEPA